MAKSQQQTLQQERAKHAWQEVEGVLRLNKDQRKEYSALVRGLPAMIQHDGLAPALAFLKAKGKEHHKTAYTQLQSWMQLQMDFQGELIEYLLMSDSLTYRHATTEAQAYLNWLKRFTEAKGWSDNG